MKEKMLVKVVATQILQGFNGRMSASVARGITPLKRGQTIADFISSFMTEREVQNFELHKRSEELYVTSPIMALNAEPKQVMTYHFVLFKASELGFNAKDLSPSELERDMKQLKKIING